MNIEYLNILKVLLIILVPLTLLVSIVMPVLLLGVALEIVFLVLTTKKIKNIKEIQIIQQNKEKELLKQGYKKICPQFFVNDKENKLNILDKVYGFSQIVDCELIEDGTSISQTIGKTKIKNIKKSKTRYQTTQLEICTGLGVNITTSDFNNPRIMFDCKYGKNITKNSKAYKEALNNAQNIISTLKIVISQNNEKYIETGTITKIEHKYITEENASIQIERLSQLHKDGVLTDYEFEMKKKELLDKIK